MAITPTVGQLVIVDPAVATPKVRGVVYRITRLLPKNVAMEPVGGGPTLRCNPAYLLDAPTGTATPPAVGQPYQRPLNPGEAVTFTRVPEAVFIVIALKTGGYSLAKLGGDGGRYWRSIDRERLTPIDPARITITPEPEPPEAPAGKSGDGWSALLGGSRGGAL